MRTQGFAASAMDRIILNVGDTRAIDVTLQIGATSETTSLDLRWHLILNRK